jgi:hypothetical protein
MLAFADPSSLAPDSTAALAFKVITIFGIIVFVVI